MTSTILFPELAEPQAALDFGTPLSEKYKPLRIEDFAGLTEPKKILRGFAANPRNVRAALMALEMKLPAQ